MIKIENVEVMGWEHAIRGMRNPMNSWEKSDSDFSFKALDGTPSLGENDLERMNKLCKAGTSERKFMRMITVYVDITAPLYWWKEFDTYKVGTVANSCSTMHKIHIKEFTLDDFSHEHLDTDAVDVLNDVVSTLNCYRDWYIDYDPDELEIKGCPSKKQIWWQMIQLLPSSYNQKRTVMLNYEVLANIYHSRKNHKLNEWRELCGWIESLPYSELITGERK